MSSSSVQKSSRGSENKQGLLMSAIPSAKEEGSRLQQIHSSTGIGKRPLETTIDTSADVRRTSEKRRKSSLAGVSTANVALLNQTMVQIPSQEEER